MTKQIQKYVCITISLFLVFVVYTWLIAHVDVKPIGPNGSSVGFAALNQSFHNLTGVHMTLYTITDWLSIFALLIMLGFVGLGVAQWIRRKELSKVDSDIFVLGGFYIIVLSAYLFFEYYVINYRPVLINNFLEPSYPSSTTLLILTVISTAVIEVHRLIQKKELRNWIDFSLCTFGTLMVIGRIFSGVHWITDIIGSFLLSSALILLYVSVNQIVKEEVKKP